MRLLLAHVSGGGGHGALTLGGGGMLNSSLTAKVAVEGESFTGVVFSTALPEGRDPF